MSRTEIKAIRQRENEEQQRGYEEGMFRHSLLMQLGSLMDSTELSALLMEKRNSQGVSVR